MAFGRTNTKENEWIKNCLTSSDSECWGTIYEKYKRYVYAKCYSIVRSEEDARDLTVESFIKAYENLQSFDLSKPFLPWLNRITINLCIDHIRKKNRIHFDQLSEHPNVGSGENITHQIELDEKKKKIKKAIYKLKKSQKRCFCLFYIQEKSYKEIAAITGYSYDEVRSNIQNGKRNFKQLMEKWV